MTPDGCGVQAAQPDLTAVLAELAALRQLHDSSHSLLWAKLCSMEGTLHNVVAWTASHAAGPTAHGLPVDSSAQAFNTGQPAASQPSTQTMAERAAPLPQEPIKADRHEHAPTWAAMDHVRVDVAEKMRLLGNKHQGDTAVYSDGMAQPGEQPQPQQYRLRDKIREVLWGRLLMPHEKNGWDVYMMVLLVWVCFGTPVVICFGLDKKFWKGHPLGIVQLSVDLFFLMDMYLNFRTAYIDKRGQLVTNRRRIARAYLAKWFLPDLISVLPLHFFLGSWSELTTLFKLLRVIRFAKIMRLFKAYRSQKGQRLPLLLEWFEMSLDKSLLNVFIAIFSVIVALHLSACIFFYMAFLKGLGPNTWVGAYSIPPDASLWTKYLNSVYWATTTVTTVGYGDITPKTAPEKLVAMPLMILGVNLLGYITSSITNIVQIRNASQKQIETKKQMVRLFLKERNIPKDLANRVTYYFHHVSLNEVRSEEKQIVEELPPKLRSRVLNYMYEETIQKVPALQGQHPDLMGMIVSNLRLEYHTKGDIVVCQGDPPRGMYFIGEGQLEVRTYDVQDQNDSVLLLSATTDDDLADWPWQLQGHLLPPGFWGQTSAMATLPAPATVVACSFCELFLLAIDDLEQVLERFPEMQDVLQPYRLPDDLRQSMAGTVKRGQIVDVDQTFIMNEYPSLAASLPHQEHHRKFSLGRLSGLFNALTRPSVYPSARAVRHSAEVSNPGVLSLARTSNTPLARASNNPLARPSNSLLPPLSRKSHAVPLGRHSMAPLDRPSLASLRRTNTSHGHSQGFHPAWHKDSSPDYSRSSSFSQPVVGPLPTTGGLQTSTSGQRRSPSREGSVPDGLAGRPHTLHHHSNSLPSRGTTGGIDVEMGHRPRPALAWPTSPRPLPADESQASVTDWQVEETLRPLGAPGPVPLAGGSGHHALEVELPGHLGHDHRLLGSPSRLAKRSLATSPTGSTVLLSSMGGEGGGAGSVEETTPVRDQEAAGAESGPGRAGGRDEPGSGSGSRAGRRARGTGEGPWSARSSLLRLPPTSSDEEDKRGGAQQQQQQQQSGLGRAGGQQEQHRRGVPVMSDGQQQRPADGGGMLGASGLPHSFSTGDSRPMILLTSSDEEGEGSVPATLLRSQTRSSGSFWRRPLALSPAMSVSSGSPREAAEATPHLSRLGPGPISTGRAGDTGKAGSPGSEDLGPSGAGAAPGSEGAGAMSNGAAIPGDGVGHHGHEVHRPGAPGGEAGAMSRVGQGQAGAGLRQGSARSRSVGWNLDDAGGVSEPMHSRPRPGPETGGGQGGVHAAGRSPPLSARSQRRVGLRRPALSDSSDDGSQAKLGAGSNM